jgi:drug/metabolite transporter (DMT)-like permease
MAKENSTTKYVALISLILQNAGLAIIMRYSLIFPSSDGKYMTSTAVLMAEVLKLVMASLACFFFDANGSIDKFVNVIKYEGGGLADWGKLAVPSVLYTIQNSLQYTAMSMLSAPVFQVCYQMKIITTALFSVVLLNRHISPLQWGSVTALAMGVALVQLSQQSGDDGKSSSVLGLVAVAAGCMTSGFAGVYFEMVLKSSRASIWLRNIQLAFIGIFMATAGCLIKDYDVIFGDHAAATASGDGSSSNSSNNSGPTGSGFFRGYNSTVWGVIMFQALGGLIVAVVVKYADNIIKNFATSFSILLSALTSSILFNDVNLNFLFVLGASIVMGSTYAFGYKPPVRVVSRSDLELMSHTHDDNNDKREEREMLLRDEDDAKSPR